MIQFHLFTLNIKYKKTSFIFFRKKVRGQSKRNVIFFFFNTQPKKFLILYCLLLK